MHCVYHGHHYTLLLAQVAVVGSRHNVTTNDKYLRIHFNNNDSLQSIVQSQYSQMHNLHLSNNATAQHTNNSVSNMSTMMAFMQQALQAVQQQLALQAGGGGGTVAAPPIPTFVPMTQPLPPALATG